LYAGITRVMKSSASAAWCASLEEICPSRAI
jgi:hypothetical protein